MKSKLLSRSSLYMMLSIAMLSSCLSAIATAEPKEVQIHLSELELQEIFRNPTRSYIYVGKEVSELANVIDEICMLDGKPESLVHGLRDHMRKGFNVANYDAVAEALEYAEEVLREKGSSLSEDRRADLTRKLNLIIDQVIDEQLNLDAEILSFMKDSVDVTADVTRHGLRLLVIPNKLDVQGRARFRKKVTFKDDVKFEEHVKIEGFFSVDANSKFRKDVTVEGDLFVEGALSVADGITVDGTTIGCDVSVGCNLLLNNSTDATVGNVLKAGIPFIHNFGIANTFVGENAGNFTMTGDGNSAFGARALQANITGIQNVAIGNDALLSNTIGFANTAVGLTALNNNISGSTNTAVGVSALHDNVTGNSNVAVGTGALTVNLASSNTAIGTGTLTANTTGVSNAALGENALVSNVGGIQNVGLGNFALQNSVSGNDNIAVGFNAGAALTT